MGVFFLQDVPANTNKVNDNRCKSLMLIKNAKDYTPAFWLVGNPNKLEYASGTGTG